MTSKNIKKYLYIVLSIIVIGFLTFMQLAYIADQKHETFMPTIKQPRWNQPNFILRYINSDWSYFHKSKEDVQLLMIIDPASDPKWASGTKIIDENNFNVTFWFDVDCSEDKEYKGFVCQHGEFLTSAKKQESYLRGVFFSKSGMEASFYIKDEYYNELQRRTLLN